MSVGLLALLDDVAGLLKVAAASIDDVAAGAAKAGAKAAGAVIDDAAVTPRYVEGFTAERELPIVGRIAWGSIKNKLIILLPIALALHFFLPVAIMPLLMIGGLYLCYEGVEKIFHAFAPHSAEEHEEKLAPVAINPKTLEDEKVAGAIKTDFILSAEIMTIALAEVGDGSFISMAATLLLVAVGITVAVYGGVALIVKADDAGVAMAKHGRLGGTRALGRGLVKGMPVVMSVLSVVGTAAMIWVGGGIVIHGLEEFGLDAPGHLIHDWAEAAHHATGAAGGFVGWLVTSVLSGIVGVVLGALLIPIASHVIAPAWRAIKGMLPRREPAAEQAH